MNDRSKLLHMLRGKLASGGDKALKITVQINCRELEAAVEYSRNSGAYWRQVSARALLS